MAKHPIQPLALDAKEVIRFKENAMVRHLLDWAQPRGMGLNEMARMEFSIEDREQFAQLIGYSLSGYGELSYVTDDSYNAARKMFDDGLTEEHARIKALEEALDTVREGLKIAVPAVFRIHPDDLASTEG